MVRNHGGVVHLVDVVARQHEHVLWPVMLDEVKVLEGGVGGTPVPVRVAASLVGLQEVNPAVHAIQVPGLPTLE